MKTCNDCKYKPILFNIFSKCNKGYSLLKEVDGKIYNNIYYIDDKGECPDREGICFDDPSGN